MQDIDSHLTYRCVKRVVDIAAALTMISLLWWLFAVIWLIVRLDSSGPGFFYQQRVGKNGRLFWCVKFRTMSVATPHVPTHEVTATSVTTAGSVLRRLKLDELPQVWNVLRNDLSFVGPRPCLPSQVELLRERDRLGVLAIMPGITGFAQINGVDMSDPRRLAAWDARYLQMRSLRLDASIMLATVAGHGGGDRIRSAT